MEWAATQQTCGSQDAPGAEEPPFLLIVVLVILVPQEAWLYGDPCSVAFPGNSHSLL